MCDMLGGRRQCGAAALWAHVCMPRLCRNATAFRLPHVPLQGAVLPESAAVGQRANLLCMRLCWQGSAMNCQAGSWTEVRIATTLGG